jgi:hypothetical protein
MKRHAISQNAKAHNEEGPQTESSVLFLVIENRSSKVPEIKTQQRRRSHPSLSW